MKRNLLLLFSAFLVLPVVAQTNAEKLEQAVKIYNALRDYEDNLKPASVSQENIVYMKAEYAKAEPLLADVRRDGSEEEASTARYFNANFNYELGFVYGMMGKNSEAYTVLSVIKADYEYFASESVFPLRYVYEGRNYSVKYENFAPTLAEYYTGMAEICANLSKNEEALGWARTAYRFSYTTDWYKYISANKIMEVKKKTEAWDLELLDIALSQIKVYSSLDSSYRQTIRENKYPSPKTGYNTIRTTLEKKPLLAEGEKHRGEAAPYLARLGFTEEAAACYLAAIPGGYSGAGKDYLFEAAEFGKNSGNKSLVTLACDKLRQIYGLSCSEMNRIAGYYDFAGESSAAGQMRSKAKACGQAEEQERKRREKRERREARDFGMYAGIYPGPLIIRYNHYRDYGFVFGLSTHKLILEGSYKLIRLNHVIYDDLAFKDVSTDGYESYWNGYRTHLAFKFISRNGTDGFYFGPLIEYVSREFRQTQSNIFNEPDGTFYAYKTFSPSEKSINLFFNYGTQQEQKHLMLDVFFGIGAAYHRFDGGVPEYGNDLYRFDNPVLENRKPSRFGVAVRAGLTIGFTTKR